MKSKIILHTISSYFQLVEPILPDMGETMTIGIDCIYACKRTDQLNHCFSIVECLPTREEGYVKLTILREGGGSLGFW